MQSVTKLVRMSGIARALVLLCSFSSSRNDAAGDSLDHHWQNRGLGVGRKMAVHTYDMKQRLVFNEKHNFADLKPLADCTGEVVCRS